MPGVQEKQGWTDAEGHFTYVSPAKRVLKHFPNRQSVGMLSIYHILCVFGLFYRDA